MVMPLLIAVYKQSTYFRTGMNISNTFDYIIPKTGVACQIVKPSKWYDKPRMNMYYINVEEIILD